MSEPHTSESGDRDDVVAYLDGELDDDRSREIERTLAESEEARHDVHVLQQTFDLLDLLPVERASADFTAKTLESVAAVEGAEGDTSPVAVDWSERTLRGALVALSVVALAVASVVGFLASAWLATSETDELVRDLPVIENLDAYTEVGSVSFLEKLRDSGLLDEEGDDVRP